MPENRLVVNLRPQTAVKHETNDPRAVLVYATFPSILQAEEISSQLVEAGVVACANLIPGMRSIYKWQGKVHRDNEVVAVLKTRADLSARVSGWLRVAHPYANPAIVVLPIVSGSPDFLEWIVEETDDQVFGAISGGKSGAAEASIPSA